MEIELQRILKSTVQADKDINNIIKILDQYPTEIDLVGGTPLNHAINYNRNEIVTYLIKRGANVNALQDGHYSPLISAVEGDNIEMVKLLLENGADINLVDKHGNSALWKAVFNDNLEIVKLLVKEGADPFKEIKDGWSIYDGAKHIGTSSIVEYFDSLK